MIVVIQLCTRITHIQISLGNIGLSIWWSFFPICDCLSQNLLKQPCTISRTHYQDMDGIEFDHCIVVAQVLGELSSYWRHNGRDSVSNHQSHDCLLNRLFRRRSKKTSKLRVTGLSARNSPGTANAGTRKMFPFDDVIMIFKTTTTFPREQWVNTPVAKISRESLVCHFEYFRLI